MFKSLEGLSIGRSLALLSALLLCFAAAVGASAEPPSCHDAAPTESESDSATSHESHAAHATHAAKPLPVEKIETQGLTIPDFELLDQEGRSVRFYSDLVEGRVVAMNFVFTTCTTVCPPMGANFAKLRKVLAERGAQDVELISVSVDPMTDTPDRLKAWARKFSAGGDDGLARWTLVTGDKARIDNLLKALKVFTPDAEDHAPIVLVGNDAAGRWERAYGLAPADRLGDLLAEMADLERVPQAGAAGGAP